MIMQLSNRPAVFLDRDGTLIKDVHYIKDPRDVVVPETVIEGLRLLREANFLLIMVSNQSGIARGYFSMNDLASVHLRMSQLLEEQDVDLDGFYYCPHAPGCCQCRKPGTGMLKQACRDFSINLSCSSVIGNDDCDMQMAKNFKIPGLLLKSERKTNPTLPTRICRDFLEAAHLAIIGVD